MALFGRKKVASSGGGHGSSAGGSGSSIDEQKNQSGHQAFLRYVREKEKEEPGIRERVTASVLFDFLYDILKDERGVNIDILLAVLASVGGQECIAAVLDAAPMDATMADLGLTVIKGNDGRMYFFGDAPNRLLVESPDSLISLAFGAAQAQGAPVTMEMIHDEMRKVAQNVGGPDFETLDLPPQHMVDRPTDWARVFGPKLAEPLDLCEVPRDRRPATIGYAIQKAMDTAKGTVDPMIAARIVLQCACRTAKVLIR
ncbi:MAG TPA: hypothetical protein VGF26_19540 [Ramlibacter sp.]